MGMWLGFIGEVICWHLLILENSHQDGRAKTNVEETGFSLF
jgi:hypothetical protein